MADTITHEVKGQLLVEEYEFMFDFELSTRLPD